MPPKSVTSASKEKRASSVQTTLVQKSRIPNGDESSEGSLSPFGFQRARKKLSESKPFSTFSSRKKREDELKNGQLKPRMRNTIYVSPYANPYKIQRASSGSEKYQTESSDELSKEDGAYGVDYTPGNSSTETITVEMIETVQKPDDVTMDNIQYTSENSLGEDSIPYFGNLFNVDKNETHIDKNDIMAVVEVGRPIFIAANSASSESGRRKPALSQISDLDRTSTQEITGISELLRSFVSYDFPRSHLHQDSVFTLPRYIATFEDERCALKTRIAAYKDSVQSQNQLVYNLQKKLVEYKSRITELEKFQEGRDGISKCSEVHQVSQMLEQEQSRVTSLVSMNSALREQLSKSQVSNASLSMELEKLTAEWQETRKLLNAHDMETQLEEKVSKEIRSAEHIRLLSLWEEVLKVRRLFVDTRSDIERQLKQIQMDFNTSVKNTSGSLTNLMALTGCEYCKEGDGLTTCWQRIKGLQSDINRVTTEKDSLNAQLEILRIENRGLVSRLRDRDTLVQNLNRTIDHLQEQNNRSSEEVGLRNRIQEELDHTKYVLQEVHRLLAEDTDENNDSLELKITRGMDGPVLPDSVVTMLRSVMDKKQLQIHDYQLSIENERQQFAELSRTMATLSCDREALQQDLLALRQDLTATNQRCEELSKQRDSCNSILESTTKGKLEVSENCRKLMKDLENLRREKASFQLSVTGLSLEKSQWIEEKESLQSQNRRAKADCTLLESQNITLREACEDLKHSLAQSRAEIQRTSVDHNLIKGQKKDLALNLQNCEKKKLELESDVSRYKSEIQVLRDQITRLEQTNSSLSKEKSHIEQLVKEAETEKLSIEHVLGELKADFSVVKEELVKTERVRSQIEIRCDSLQETLQMTEVDKEKYLSDLQEVEKVKEELSTQLIIVERERSQILTDLEARSVLLSGFEQEVGRLKVEKTGLETKICQLEAKLVLAEDSLKSQQDINSSISSTRQQIELSLYAAQSEIDSLQEKANRLQGQLEETVQEKNQLRFQLTSTERSNEARFANARKEIEELTELISKRNDELKKLTHEKDSNSLSLVKEKEKLRQSFESQIIGLQHRFDRDKEEIMSAHTEELRHLRQQMSSQARKFDENLEAAESDKQQSLKFARSEQQVLETRLQKALTELEVTRAEVMKIRSESTNRTSSDRVAMNNLRNELNKLQDELVQESSRHSKEISLLEKKHNDALQALELTQTELSQLKCSLQSALMKNESTLEKMAELERQLEEALGREQSLKAELTKLQNQLSAIVKERDSILSSSQEVKAQMRDLESEGNELQGIIDESHHKISLLEEAKLKLEEELNVARNMINGAEKRIVETEATFSENNRNIASLKSKLQNLHSDLEINEARLQAEKSRAEVAETQLNELNDQLKGALNKCDNLERDVLSIRRASALKDDSYKSQEEELRKKIQELATKGKRLEDEKNNLELKFGTNVEEISHLSQKLRTAEERCEQMQALSKKLEEQKNDIALRLASVMSSLKKVTGVTDKLNLDKHPPSPIRRLAQFRSAAIASEGMSGRSSESLKDIDTESVNSTMRDLVMQSAKLEKERDDSISRTQALERKVEELHEKLDQSEGTITQLKNALGKANCEHKTLQQQVSSLENTLKEKESAEAMKMQMVTASEEKLQVLEGKQRALLEEKGTLEDALNKVKLKLVQNEYEIKRLNQQIEAAQFQLNKSEAGRKSLEQELSRVQKLLRDKELEYQALQSKSECLQQNIVRLQQRCDTLQSQVDKLQASEDVYKNRELSLKDQLTRLNVSTSQENSALNQMKEQNLEYQRQLTSMEAEKRVLEDRLEMMRGGNSELRRENSHLHEGIASLKTEVSSLKTKVAVLEEGAKNTQFYNQERTVKVESDTVQRLQKLVKEKQDLQERVNILTRQLSQVEKEKWDIARQSSSSKFDLNKSGSEEENFLVQSLRRQIARMEDRLRDMEREHTASFEETRNRHKQERMRDAERMRELQISAQRQAEARERALKTRTEALERQVHYLRIQLEKDTSMSDLKNVVKNSLRTVASEPRLDSDLFKREITKLDNALSRHMSSSNMPS